MKNINQDYLAGYTACYEEVKKTVRKARNDKKSVMSQLEKNGLTNFRTMMLRAEKSGMRHYSKLDAANDAIDHYDALHRNAKKHLGRKLLITRIALGLTFIAFLWSLTQPLV